MNLAEEAGEAVNRNGRPTGLDAAVLIFILTALAYLIAFSFEDGYLTHFGIPTEFEDVTLRGLLFCAASASGIAVLALGLATSFATILPKDLSSYVFQRVSSSLLFIVAMAVAPWLTGAAWTTWVFALFVPVSYAFFELIMPIFAFGHEPTYAAKLLAGRRADKFKDRELGARLRNSRVPPWIVLGLFFSMVVLTYAHSLGVYVARTQETFTIVEDTVTCAVLRVRDEGLLCAEFDGPKHAAVGSFKYVDPQRVILKVVKIGRLTKYDASITRQTGAVDAGEIQKVQRAASKVAP